MLPLFHVWESNKSGGDSRTLTLLPSAHLFLNCGEVSGEEQRDNVNF